MSWMLLLGFAVTIANAQTALPHLKPLKSGCLPSDVTSCKISCPSIYHDTSRFTCPCYSKMGECLVRIGCSFSQRKDAMASCTRKGYCKAGYCTYRLGDFTPKLGARREIFDATAIVPPDSPCIDGCCPGSASCTENPVMKALRQPGRAYRLEEPKLPPRYGDPRLSVNQNYNLMPYSLPLGNLPAVSASFLQGFAQEASTAFAHNDSHVMEKLPTQPEQTPKLS